MIDKTWICVYVKTTKKIFVFSAPASELKENLKMRIRKKITDSDLEFGFFPSGVPHRLELFFLERGRGFEEISSIRCIPLI